MTKSKRVMRKLILARLYDRLREQYAVIHPREVLLNEEVSFHELDALLAFKSDPRLEELRLALDRLEDGTYGICIGCKSLINQAILDKDPAQRVCETCEHKFVHVVSHQPVHTSALP